MDLRQLRYFVAVAEELSFTAAARRLNISQPPLSMQIMALESTLGAQLIDRTHRSITLTDAGKVFLEHVRQTLSQLNNGVEMTQRAARGEAGLLRLAFTGSVPLVPGFASLIKAFRREWPLARLQIEHMPTGMQLKALEEGRIDVGMLRPSPYFRPPAHLVLTEFWRDELCVVLPEGHALANSRQPIPVKAVASMPLILFPRGIGCGLHDHVTTLCNQAGVMPQVVYEAREGTTIVGLVAAGVGISLLPTAYEQLGTDGVSFAPLEPSCAASQLYLARRPDSPSLLAERFLTMARELAYASRGKARIEVARNPPRASGKARRKV